MKQPSPPFLLLIAAALVMMAGMLNYYILGSGAPIFPAMPGILMETGITRNFFTGYFSDGCWCIALCLVCQGLETRIGAGRWFIFSLPFLLELAQKASLVPGTFDWGDMVLYALVMLVFFSRFIYRQSVSASKGIDSFVYSTIVCIGFGILAIACATPARTSYKPKPLPCITHKGMAYSPLLTKINLSGSYTMKDLSTAQRFAYDYLFEQLVTLNPGKYKLSDGVTPNLSLDITINTDSYQHYGATLNMYVSDGSVYYNWNTDYITIQKLYDDIAAKINVFVSYGWCTNCPGPCNP
jgi:hypothetical protein